MIPSTYHALRWMNLLVILALILPPPIANLRTKEAPSIAVDAAARAANLASQQRENARHESRSAWVYIPISLVTRSSRSEVVQPTHSVQASSTAGSLGTVGDLIYVANSKQIGRTRNFSSASPTWISITGALTGTIYDFVLDPFDPFNQAWAVGTTGVWKTTNLDADAPTWTQILSKEYLSATLAHDPWGPDDGWGESCLAR